MKRFLTRSAASAVIIASMVLPAYAATTPVKPKLDPACMATAASTRDTSISTALATVVTAIQTRGTAIAAAWTNNPTDATARKTALKAADAAFDGTWKTFNTTRKAAWTTYKTAAKACHATASQTDTQSSTAGM